MPSDSARIPYRFVFDRLSPYIPVKLIFNETEIAELAYVDSGAWYSIFRTAAARELGIVLEAGKAIWTKGLNGQRISVYLHRIDLDIVGFRITANICFSDQLGIGFNLLGRDSVFDVLQFCFNDRDGELSVSRL